MAGQENRSIVLPPPLVGGLVLCLAIAVTDLVAGSNVILIPLLVIAPLATAVAGTPRQTVVVGSVATAFAVGLGWADDIEGSWRHWVAIATTVVGTAIGAWLAVRRQRERARSLPALRQADRLRATLATGRMGEWSWDTATGEVVWDDNVAALFGRFDEPFGGTFDAWMALIDPRDRERVRRAVEAAVVDGSTFRFDHRCSWPDGSIHWIEGIGEVIVDDTNVLGAFGLAIDVTERQLQIEDRNRLVDIERRERRRVEFLAGVHDVLALSVDTDEIVERITGSIIPQLADWCSIVVSADRPADRPLIRVAHHDPTRVEWAHQVEREFPYDPDADWGAAKVIRTGRREFVERVDPRILEFPGGDVLRDAGVGSIVTVALVGAIGTLGAMQLIRSPEVAAFGPDELDFVDELAGRVGSALNTAVLFERQARSRAALDTLEQVSGRFATLSTAQGVMRAALVHASQGVGAVAGTLFLAADDELRAEESVGPSDAYDAAIELDAARAAIRDGITTSQPLPDVGTVVGVPMQIMNRTTGAIVLIVPTDRLLVDEELSMLVTLGSRCAGALERASLYERDRTVALALQQRLLSVLPKTPPWLEAAARYVPATALEIGGDWFQILDAGRGRIAAIVGDAVGHGVTSAAAMGQLRASIATAVANDPAPGRTLAAVDLFARLGADTLCASVASILLAPTGHGQYVCAGLPPPLRATPGQRVELLTSGRRPLLGLGDADVDYPQGDFELVSGDLVVMYTDGLVERRGESIDSGLERLRRSVETGSHLSPEELCDRVLAEVAAEGPDDDIALLILRYL